MSEWADEILQLTLLIGLFGSSERRVEMVPKPASPPAAIGWLGIGILLRFIDSQWQWINNGNREAPASSVRLVWHACVFG